MSAALEKRDDKAYGLLKARQDLSVAQASVQLQSLNVKEANDQKKLAQLQRNRVDITSSYYQELLSQQIRRISTSSRRSIC